MSPNTAMESASGGRLTRKSEALLLASQRCRPADTQSGAHIRSPAPSDMGPHRACMV